MQFEVSAMYVQCLFEFDGHKCIIKGRYKRNSKEENFQVLGTKFFKFHKQLNLLDEVMQLK